ncbi:MAG: hypothetical protein ACU0A6_05680 [Shimia sp.]|uniref:hypothetical protein n=1 Tax=Shimia sp. TaxID=1954381 RepID=UPI00405907ED
MDANLREMIVKVASASVLVNFSIAVIACLLMPREEWAHDLPIVLATSMFLSIVVSVVLVRQAQTSQGLAQ